MSIGWKDVIATVLTAGAAVITYAKLNGFNWPLLGSYRTASVVLMVFGIGACIAATWSNTPFKDNWTILASILGSFAFWLGLVNLIANSQILLVALTINIIALWAITTFHHFIQNRV